MRQWRHRPGKRQQVFRQDATLAVFPTDIDLQADIEWRILPATGSRQALGHQDTIDTVHPVEVGCNQTGLVALDRADKMPHQRQIGQNRLLVQGFLHIVFGKIPLAGLRQRTQVCRRKRLAYRNQGNVLRIPAGRQSRLRQPVPNHLQS